MVAVSEEFQSRFTVCAGSRFSSQDFQNIDFELKFVLETNSAHYDALKKSWLITWIKPRLLRSSTAINQSLCREFEILKVGCYSTQKWSQGQ